MASSVNAVMSIGTGALFASQTAIQTTGNNISNVNTVGYSRQAVRFEEMPSLDYRPGQMGQGVKAAEVFRYFDKFIERSYLNTSADEARYAAQYEQLRNVESLFNESNTGGISKLMQQFFGSWTTLSQNPSSQAAREDIINKSQTLADTIKNASQTLTYLEDRVNDLVKDQVAKANTLIKDIASLNVSISTHTVEHQNNPNSLLDARDQKVRELAGLIDVDVIDRGDGHYLVNTKSGYTLVDDTKAFSLEYRGAAAEFTPEIGSTFKGNINFGGSDGYEYTLRVTQAGGSGVAKYNTSLDGGKTWISDDSGNPIEYTAYDDATGPGRVKDLDISFDFNSTNLSVGDQFRIVPKNAVYWIEPTRGALDISPQVMQDGTLDQRRMTGGAIAGNLIFKDYQAEQYRDKLDTFAKTLIFEVNRIHSQGAGLEAHSAILGDYRVGNPTVPLGLENSGFTFKDNIQPGNFVFAIYDKDGKPALTNPGISNAFTINFDPATDSLDDVVNNINATMGDYITASVVDNRLQLVARDPDINGKSGNKFQVSDDTTGLLAGLGINTFFKGDSSNNIELSQSVMQNRNLINGGRVNGGAEFNPGDNITAKELGKLAEKSIDFANWTGRTTTQTFGGYYATIVSNIGGETSSAKFSNALEHTKAADLADRQSEVSGVNLDEEMSNLIKFQASYKAAAKLITTADQMLQTLLSLKQ